MVKCGTAPDPKSYVPPTIPSFFDQIQSSHLVEEVSSSSNKQSSSIIHTSSEEEPEIPSLAPEDSIHEPNL
jgi:hypothetical protein